MTDNLKITHVSPILGLSILKELKVPFSDIEELTVHVGKEEVGLVSQKETSLFFFWLKKIY